MKNLLPLGIFCVLLVLQTHGQDDSTQYIDGIPVTESDTARDFPSNDFYPKDHHELIQRTKLPVQLRKVLDHNSLYHGWQQFPVYLDKNSNLYMIRIKQENILKVFGLDDHGNVVTYDEVEID